MGDLRDKRRAYCRNGVREYLVWLVAEACREWFCLEDDDYRPQLPDAQGVLHSRVFPGLRLPVAPLLAGDTAKVLAALTGHEPLNRKPPGSSVNSEDACSFALAWKEDSVRRLPTCGEAARPSAHRCHWPSGCA
jgi:hypothetical protein